MRVTSLLRIGNVRTHPATVSPRRPVRPRCGRYWELDGGSELACRAGVRPAKSLSTPRLGHAETER